MRAKNNDFELVNYMKITYCWGTTMRMSKFSSGKLAATVTAHIPLAVALPKLPVAVAMSVSLLLLHDQEGEIWIATGVMSYSNKNVGRPPNTPQWMTWIFTASHKLILRFCSKCEFPYVHIDVVRSLYQKMNSPIFAISFHPCPQLRSRFHL